MFYSTRFLFQPCVTYYKCKFITIEFLKMRHWEILSQEFFGEFYADTFFDCLSNIYINASGDSSSEYISDSGDVNIRPTKRKKNLSDWFWYKKWNWNSGCWRRYYRCVTTECNNLRSEVKSLSRVRLFAAPWTIAYQVPLFMGFSRQEYWSGLPFPSPGDFSDPGIEPRSPALQADALPSKPPGKSICKVLVK